MTGSVASPKRASCAAATRAKSGAAAAPPVWFGRRGSSSATTITSRGASAGTTPMNQAVKRSAAYWPSAGSSFWAEPVFPATRRPCSAARPPVPSGPTTPSSISSTLRAVSREITRSPSFGSTVCQAPRGARRAATRRGSTRVPPFASAAVATASWIGVTERPWPNATVAWSTGRQREAGRSMPADSSGKPLPVRSPKPKRRSISK